MRKLFDPPTDTYRVATRHRRPIAPRTPWPTGPIRSCARISSSCSVTLQWCSAAGSTSSGSRPTPAPTGCSRTSWSWPATSTTSRRSSPTGTPTAIPVTFRAAGTSLSGQSQGDGILVEVMRHWIGCTVEDGGRTLRSKPGTILARANAALKRSRLPARARPGVEGGRNDRRRRGQQRQRDVLRDGRELLPDTALDDDRAAVGDGRRHRGAGRRGASGPGRAGDRRRAGRDPGRDPGRPGRLPTGSGRSSGSRTRPATR